MSTSGTPQIQYTGAADCVWSVNHAQLNNVVCGSCECTPGWAWAFGVCLVLPAPRSMDANGVRRTELITPAAGVIR